MTILNFYKPYLMMRNQTILFLSAILFSVCLFTACDDDDVTRSDADLSYTFNYKIGNEALAYDQVYDIGGVMTSFQTVQFYVSSIELHPEEGDHIKLEDKHLLVTPTSNTHEITTVDKQHFHMTKFFIGVTPEANSQTEEDFTTRSTDDPLAKRPSDEPRMHWNWNAGYIFVRIDGMVDTDGDGTPETGMEFHIGTDNFRKDVTLELHTDVDKDAQAINIGFDVASLFTGIDLATENQCHTGDAPELAMRFAGNIAGAFAKE